MLIDNKDALTAVDDCNYKIMSGYEWIRKQEIKKRLKELPSAESQVAIKDCRNCKHGKYNDHWGTCFCYNPNDCADWNLWEPDKELSAESEAYKQGWADGQEALRKEIWEDGRDRLN